MKKQGAAAGYQVSESFVVGSLLAVVGGYLDAYTYICRGHVFANAQTGNIVFLGFSVVEGKWFDVLHYAIMIAAFVLGVVIAETVAHLLKSSSLLHWRQIVVLLEICLLFAVAFIPSGVWDLAVNATIGCVSAMQVNSFRKVRGISAATTMCTGNLRSGTEQLCSFVKTKDRSCLRKAFQYFSIIILFIGGVILGTALTNWWGVYSSLCCCAVLAAVFGLLFVKERQIP